MAYQQTEAQLSPMTLSAGVLHSQPPSHRSLRIVPNVVLCWFRCFGIMRAWSDLYCLCKHDRSVFFVHQVPERPL